MTSSDDKPEEKPARKSRKLIRVRATHDGYRRGGRAWTRQPTDLPADSLTREQLDALEADPRITVEH